MTMKENENAASFDFESFTDKKVMECDLPELEVCYKDIDCQILKDICVDEGRPERDVNVIESFNDEKPGLSIPDPPNDKVHFETAEDSSQECTNDLNANQCVNKEANDGANLVSEGKLDSSLDNSFEKHCDPENSAQIGEANSGADITQPSDQILNGKTESESPDTSSAEVRGKAEEHSAESGDVTAITENVEEQLVNIEDGNSDGSVKHVGNNDSSSETAQEQKSETKDATNHDNSSSDDPVLFSKNENVQAVEPKLPQHERNNSSGQASVVNPFYRDEGETSFSAASLITYSGPIAFSGSLSHRSDGSTTSAKSFAFPVLQSEWTSSPVRMAKADRRHFRKHKSWRSGILCCRF